MLKFSGHSAPLLRAKRAPKTNPKSTTNPSTNLQKINRRATLIFNWFFLHFATKNTSENPRKKSKKNKQQNFLKIDTFFQRFPIDVTITFLRIFIMMQWISGYKKNAPPHDLPGFFRVDRRSRLSAFIMNWLKNTIKQNKNSSPTRFFRFIIQLVSSIDFTMILPWFSSRKSTQKTITFYNGFFDSFLSTFPCQKAPKIRPWTAMKAFKNAVDFIGQTRCRFLTIPGAILGPKKHQIRHAKDTPKSSPKHM